MKKHRIIDTFVVEIDGDRELVEKFQKWIIENWNQLDVKRGSQYSLRDKYSLNTFGIGSKQIVETFFNEIQKG